MSVGIDIGTRTITIVEMKSGRGGTQVVELAGGRIPRDAAREGQILDVDSVATQLKEVVANSSISSKKVHIGVSNTRAAVRQVELPWMDDDELKKSLRYQVNDAIPMPIEEAEVDYHRLGESGEGGDRKMRLLIAAAHRDMVNTYVKAATRAGLSILSIDLNPFAMLRALAPKGSNGAGTLGSGSQFLIDIGGGVTNVVVHENGTPKFVRIVPVGSDRITEALAQGASMPVDEAERHKVAAVLGQPAEGPAGRIIEDQTNLILAEIKESLDFYLAKTGRQAAPNNVVVTGGGALLNGFAARLESQMGGLPVEVGNALKNWPLKKGLNDPGRDGPAFTTAIGLALGGLS